jgi:mannose-6-phosphate isomerase-like protein (cupin superfamily)
MQGYISNIEDLTEGNDNFRKVLYTSKYSQLVLMSLKPGEEIGEEVHQDIDQFFRFESGEGKVVIDGVEHAVKDDFAVIVPAGANHNVVNTSSDKPLKLYTIYSPPEHKDGIIHQTKEEAMADEDDHFDGRTSE